jgi:ABC-2 type transport system permease protein
MRRLWTILRRDFISITRDAILVYVVVVPFLLSFGLRLFLPGLSQAGINVVITERDAPALVEKFEPYVYVEVVQDDAELQRRVLAFDDAVAIRQGLEGQYELVLEGNETHDSRILPEMVLQKAVGSSSWNPAMEEVGQTTQLFREWFAVFITLSVLFLGSIVMGLHIVEDKETRMILALGVSPLTRRIYIAARSLLAVGLSLVLVFGSLIVMGLTHFNGWQILSVTLAGALAAILFGFVMGALSSNQIHGIANLKFGFLLVLLPGILTLLLPEQWWIALWWMPTYWIFSGFRAVLVDNAGWDVLLPILAANIAISVVYLAIAYPWLGRRLDFARD